MPSFPHIEDYRAELARAIAAGGSRNERSVRRPFANLLQKYCARAELVLVDEIADETSGKTNIPDGVVKTAFRLDHGHWEAKDEKDDLDREIAAKFRRGYPRFNILFENTRAAVLIQNGREAMRVADMGDDARLDGILRAFVGYARPEIADFRRALDQFKADLPSILAVLREAINKARHDNKRFAAASREFLLLCQNTINPNVGPDDIREMLIQHILTGDIFRRIFGEDQFHSENNIARKLEGLAGTFFVRDFRRNTVDKLKSYYAAIVRAAADLSDHREKQKFLKAVYEEFYRVYNPKAAARLGVVYTPSELVDFMIRSANQLVESHFNRSLWDDRVQILDPAAGTGTFIAELIHRFPVANLRRKYGGELHANEVAILPYYIANLNIEHAYKLKAGEYREFSGICFVDTLDNLAFKGGGKKTERAIGGFAAENTERIRRQNEEEISVVLGNPPWFANQRSENEDNKSREYPGVDARVKATYIKESAAQKTKLYDMYARFVRWASDRIGENGVVAFVTNSSFIDAKGFDGFRKVVAREFNELRILDLRGNSRLGRDEAARQGGNIFNVRVGVAVWFFVRNANLRGCKIWHHAVSDGMSAAGKLALLFPNKALGDFEFRSIVPDNRHDWVNQADSDFADLAPMIGKVTKGAKTKEGEKSVFKLYFNGVATNRDGWVYDLDPNNLKKKVRFFAKEYNGLLGAGDASFPPVLKWSRDLKNEFRRGRKISPAANVSAKCFYRPFTVRHWHADFVMNDVLTQNHRVAFGARPERGANKAICFNARSAEFFALAADCPADLHFTGDSQCIPLYRSPPNGKRDSNVTACGLSRFREHYGDAKIMPEDIFHYAYAVFHNPAYRRKYARDLMCRFPRLPFYADFRKWAKRGAKLMALHLGFENAKPFPLVRRDSEGDAGRAKLRADRDNGRIVVDGRTVLEGVPPEAWEYKLGGRSALEWVLDQHKDKRVRDATVSAKFPPPPFSGRKEEVIELLRRVCAVSVETVRITREMEKENA